MQKPSKAWIMTRVALIEEVNLMITPQVRVYSHKWASRQCIVWDNAVRCTVPQASIRRA